MNHSKSFSGCGGMGARRRAAPSFVSDDCGSRAAKRRPNSDALMPDLVVTSWIFIALAGTQMPLLYNDVIAHDIDSDTFRYAIDASVAVLVAILGLWSRHRWVAQNHAANLVESPIP